MFTLHYTLYYQLAHSRNASSITNIN